MTLQVVVETIEAVPEALRSFYVEKDGKFHLPVEGVVSAEEHKTFRNNNIQLLKQNKELLEKFEGIDPVKVRELQEQQRKLEEGKLLTEGKAEEVFAARLAPVKKDFETKLTAAEQRALAAERRLEGLLIDDAIRDAATKAGVRPTAVEDVLLRGRQAFKLVDGKAVPMSGDEVLYGKTGQPMSMDEWLAALTEKAPHLFEQSQGGGAQGARGGGGSGAGTISRTDSAAFFANVGKIAANQVKVR